MRSIPLIALLFLLSENVSGQRISSGISLSIPGVFSSVHYDQNTYSPQNNFAIYFVNPPDATHEKYRHFSTFGMGSWYHHVGIGVGYLVKADYKRFTLRTGYQLNFEGSSVELNQLGWASSMIDEYPAVFKLFAFHHQFPLLFTIDLKKKNNSPFILFGVETGFMFAKIEKMDWEDALFYDRYNIPFLYGLYYDRNLYFNYRLGAGIKRKKFEWTLYYRSRFDRGKNKLSMDHSSIDFGMNFFLSYKSFKRSHYLYQDE